MTKKPKRFIAGYFPMYLCNLSCDYCYIKHLPDYYQTNQKDPLYSAEHIARCLRPQRLGGICLINLTGEGETLLQPGLVQLCRLLLEEGHYLEIVSNLTVTKTLNELLRFPECLLERLTFKVSFHYRELQKKKLLEHFWNNVDSVRRSPCSFSLELMSSDEQIPMIPEIIKECELHVGAKCHVTVGRKENTVGKCLLTDMAPEQYERTWSVFDSEMFRFKMRLLYQRRREFCYAGDWGFFLNMNTGEARSCYGQPDSQNLFKDPDCRIHFQAVGNHCIQPYCFNGHAHLALGMIPELVTPCYSEIRNRSCENGCEWFREKTKTFFSSRLSEQNQEYSFGKKLWANFAWYFRAGYFAMRHCRKTIRYLIERIK